MSECRRTSPCTRREKRTRVKAAALACNQHMHRALPLLMLVTALVGCRSYVEPTPSRISEGDPPASYAQVFHEPIPSDVTVLNAMVASYSFRPGVVTTDDFEFEMIAPGQWIQRAAKRFYLRKSEGEFVQRQLDARRSRARPWYAPRPLDQYDLYRDLSSVGYVHMLVQKEAEADGRQRVFISKH
jgi:hypothetical protein